MELEQKHGTQKLAEAGKPNLTGIPLQMKHSFERSSGLSFDDVRVHYHSALPARLGALAYTQGSHVYVGPGQERHLGHELGHVVQQKQGRVRATSVLGGVKINTSPAMEREADMLSRQAARGVAVQMRQAPSSQVIQMVQYSNINRMWRRICKNGQAAAKAMIQQAVDQDSVLAELYNDAAQQVTNCDFREDQNIKSPYITLNQNPPPTYIIYHEQWPSDQDKQHIFVSAIIHELTHAAVRAQYHRNIPDRVRKGGQEVRHVAWLNMNLPPNPSGPPPAIPIAALVATPPASLPSVTKEQRKSMDSQNSQLLENIYYLRTVVNNDIELQRRSSTAYQHLTHRLRYMNSRARDHYDAVLGDMMFYLQFEQLQDTPSYALMQRMLREANDRRHQRRWFGNDQKPFDFSNVSCYSWY